MFVSYKTGDLVRIGWTGECFWDVVEPTPAISPDGRQACLVKRLTYDGSTQYDVRMLRCKVDLTKYEGRHRANDDAGSFVPRLVRDNNGVREYGALYLNPFKSPGLRRMHPHPI